YKRQLPTYAEPTGSEESAGCGCVPAARDVYGEYGADFMLGRAIAKGLAEFGVTSQRRSVAVDESAQAVAVRVATDHGIYALHIPPRGKRYTVARNGRRDGSLEARRVPSTTDSLVSALFAAYLRDRGVL
uniref:hypothetical protein n=1 Tax=Streptomyces chryseus TaxID=68186 RepID=UPI00110F710C